VFAIVAPLLCPGWAIEWIIRKRWKNFEFRIFSAVPYFLAVAITATACAIWLDSGAVRAIAVYALAIMEFLALATCAVIAVVRAGKLQDMMLRIARRRYSRRTVPANGATIFAAVISGCYSVLFFGVLSYSLWRGDNTFYGDVPGPAPAIYHFWQFFQSSFLVFINNDGSIIAERFISQVIWDIERIIGIFLLVFLLAVLASGWTESALKNAMPERVAKQDGGDSHKGDDGQRGFSTPESDIASQE
jgi:hypothetical protein